MIFKWNNKVPFSKRGLEALDLLQPWQGPSFTSNDGPFSADSFGTKWSISVHAWYRIFLPLLLSNTWAKWRTIRGKKVYSFSKLFSTKCKEIDLVKVKWVTISSPWDHFVLCQCGPADRSVSLKHRGCPSCFQSSNQTLAVTRTIY